MNPHDIWTAQFWKATAERAISTAAQVLAAALTAGTLPGASIPWNACHRPTPSQAHCGACHVSFGGVTGFDAHRKGGVCASPASLGYVERNQVWRAPLDEAGAARLAEARLPVSGTSTQAPSPPPWVSWA